MKKPSGQEEEIGVKLVWLFVSQAPGSVIRIRGDREGKYIFGCIHHANMSV